MRNYKGLKLAARTPVYDHADSVLYFAPRPKTIELLESGRAEILGTAKRLRGLRLAGPDPALLPGGSAHRQHFAMPHRHETYYNLRGVWHIDRIPVDFKCLFTAVLVDCLRAA